MIADLLKALVLGFTYGLGPCTISCAPLVVPLIMSVARNKTHGVILSLIFSAGRVAAYVILGLVSGLLGATLNFVIPNKIMGIIIILLGLTIILGLPNKCLFNTKVKITGPWISFIMGAAMGFGPCPPLIALLGLVVLTKSALTGALMGLVFGIGTVVSPLIILAFFSGWFAKQREFQKVLPYVSGGFLIIFGALYLL
jgi:sulfite exporter TauE/SafE